MIQHILDPRELALEGSVNFRDLGGIETATGERIRSRQVFRSDALHGLTVADLDLLADYGIAMLVDLRDNREIERSGPSPLLTHGTRVFHAPLMDSAGTNVAPDPSMQMDTLYGQMLERARPRFGEIFIALADEPNLPAVIHCVAGKDRTGVTVALLLRLLDVPDVTIVQDYALTDRNMSRLMANLAAAGYLPEQPQYPQHFIRAEPETMERFLHALDATFGSAQDYLREAGLSAAEETTIRRRLLETA